MAACASFAYVRVASAIAGTELLSQTVFPCEDVVQRVLEALGSRPSRAATLFLNGKPVHHLEIAPGDRVDFTAVISNALTEEERLALVEVFAHHLDRDRALGFFAHLSDGAKDDPVVAKAAAVCNGGTLEFASTACKNDEEIVLAAVRNYSFALRHASDACRGQARIVAVAAAESPCDVRAVGWALPSSRLGVVAAMRNYGMALEFVPGWAMMDKDIVLAAVQQNGLALEFVWCFQQDREVALAAVRQDVLALEQGMFVKDKEIVLAAVQQNGLALQFAGDFVNDKEIVLAAVRQEGSSLAFAGAACRNDEDVVVAAGV